MAEQKELSTNDLNQVVGGAGDAAFTVEVWLKRDLCIGCGICKVECPVGAIEEHDLVFEINEAACINCMACIDVCPMGALQKR